MKKFNLGIKDKRGVEVCEGSVLGINTSGRKNCRDGSKIIKKKVVFGKANPDQSALTQYIGFWAIPMDCSGTTKDGINYYSSVTSIQYLITCQHAEVIGCVYDGDI